MTPPNAARRALVALLLCCTGCATGRRTIPAVAAAPAPTAPADTQTAWWTTFGSRALDTLVATALAENADIRLAVARLAESRASAHGTSGNWQPTLTPSADLTRSQQVIGNFGAITTTVASVANRASWELDLFGKLKQERVAATSDRLAATYDVADVRRTTVAQIVRGFFDVLSTSRQLSALEAQLALRRDTRALEAARARAGLSAPRDSVQADAAEQEVLVQLPDMHARRAEAVADLSTLTGRSIAWVDSLLGQVPSVDSGPPVPDTGVPAELLRTRPDVRAAEVRVLAAAARVRVAQRALRPSLSLGGSIGRNRTNDAGWVGTWSFGPSLALTLPTRANRAQVDVRRAQLEQREIEWRRAVHDAASDAELAFVRVRRTREQLQLQRSVAATYRELSAISRTRYRSGLSDLRDVIDAQQKQLSAERTLLDQWAAYAKAVVTLYQAAGWAPSSG